MRTKPKRRKVIHKSRSRTPLRQLHRRDGYENHMASDRAVDRDEQEELISRDGTDPLSLEATFDQAEGRLQVPDLYTTLPPIKDTLTTDTSVSQDNIIQRCLPHLSASGSSVFSVNGQGIPSLERENHIDFLHSTIENARYIPYDSVRPWVLYWSLTALSLLGENVETYQQRVVETLSACQNLGGGFGAGHGQLSHVATSYAAVLSLAIVGGSESLDMIGRRALWRWLGQLKQSDGGFSLCVGGEEDVRGAYCSMTIISLLALPLELPPNAPTRARGFASFLDGLPEYLSRCQTFEGGISGRPQSEAHGAYAFCALACLCIIGSPREMLPKYLDLPLLISWLSSRQHAPEGGFSGRTNKLVDGCYSHWVGGCWPLIEAAMNASQTSGSTTTPKIRSWYSQEGLTRYILSCCQADDGGMRDKPNTIPDAYHTCYTLAGLSATQHYSCYSGTRNAEAGYPLNSAFHWDSSKKGPQRDMNKGEDFGDARTMLGSLHPIYVIPWGAVERCHGLFSQKTRF
ncbi:hypothetical protein N7G274_006267 [Stereocaulon virgatum]|uniref:Protein farnesyltransferase subunit beta n=1 Tax=Stereocaulon virgatum TaxID=373712 RepID=A0ABR4A5P7_9LECA